LENGFVFNIPLEEDNGVSIHPHPPLPEYAAGARNTVPHCETSLLITKPFAPVNIFWAFWGLCSICRSSWKTYYWGVKNVSYLASHPPSKATVWPLMHPETSNVRKNQGHPIKLIISLPQKFLNVPTVPLLIVS